MRPVSDGPTATPSITPARSGRWNAGPAPSFTSLSSMREGAYSVAVRALERELLESVVRVESAPRGHEMPGAVGAELPREDVVGQGNVEDLLQAQTQPGVRHGNDSFHAAVEIARHEVRRAEVVLGPAGVAERKDARVLEELANDRADTDPVCQARPPRPHPSHPPAPKANPP